MRDLHFQARRRASFHSGVSPPGHCNKVVMHVITFFFFFFFLSIRNATMLHKKLNKYIVSITSPNSIFLVSGLMSGCDPH